MRRDFLIFFLYYLLQRMLKFEGVNVLLSYAK